MEINITLDITDCRDCIFTYDHRGHGECWTECQHKDHSRGAYETILWGCQQSFAKTPDWCPLGLGG